MKLDATSLKILKIIASSNKTSANEISKEIKLSKGSVYPRIEKINYWLKLHKLNQLISNNYSGFSILDEDKERIVKLIQGIDNEYILQPNERVDNIIIHLISSSEKIDISHLSKLNRVSRNTTLNDIKKAAINTYNIIIQYDRNLGYILIGNEILIRNLAFEIIQKNLHSKINFIQNTLKRNIYKSTNINILYTEKVFSTITNDIQFHTGIKFTDKDKNLFISLLYILISRTIKNKNPSISLSQLTLLQHHLNLEIIKDIATRLNKAMEIDKKNQEYLYLSLLTTVLKSERDLNHNSKLNKQLTHCIERMISSFEKLSGLYFINREKLNSQLRSHLRPAIVRSSFGIKIINILKNEVYENYPIIMDIVRIITSDLETTFNINLDEDELCYIAMNFASHVSNEDRRINKTKHILLVTEGGKSSTRLLESQILNLSLFPIILESISSSDINYNLNQSEYAFIISTPQTLNIQTDLDIVHVNHILTGQQQIKIKLLLEGKDYSWLTRGLSEKIAREIAGKKLDENTIKLYIDELLEEEVKKGLLIRHGNSFSFSKLGRECMIIDKCENWSNAINLVGEQLVLSGRIDKRYLESIKENISQFGQYMYLTEDIFLLHASPIYNLKRTADIALLKINKFSAINGNPALIFLLVTSERGEQLKILEQLTPLLTNEGLVQRLLNTSELSSLQEIILSLE